MKELFIHPLWDWRGAIASPYGPENPLTRHVLLTIALHMSAAGDSAFPTVQRLADETALHRATVIAHTKIAQRAGWLGKRERPEKSGQGWRRIEYIPLVPPGVEQAVKAWREERRTTWKEAQPEGGRPPRPPQGGRPDSKKVVVQDDPNTPVVIIKKEPPVDNFPIQHNPLKSIQVELVREANAKAAARRGEPARQARPPAAPVEPEVG